MESTISERDTDMNQAHIDDYLARSGDAIISDGQTEYAEHGFCIWEANEETFLIIQVYGDFTYWNQWAENKAKSMGYTKISAATKRNPNGFIRKYGYELTGYILERSI